MVCVSVSQFYGMLQENATNSDISASIWCCDMTQLHFQDVLRHCVLVIVMVNQSSQFPWYLDVMQKQALASRLFIVNIDWLLMLEKQRAELAVSLFANAKTWEGMSVIAHGHVGHPKEQIQMIFVLMQILKRNYSLPLGNCERVYFLVSVCS